MTGIGVTPDMQTRFVALQAVAALADDAGLDGIMATEPGMGPLCLVAAPGGTTFTIRDTTDGLRVQTDIGGEPRTLATTRTAARAIGAVLDHIAGVPV